jgi:hypothetical protein
VANKYCRNCGHELAEDDHFCPNCGRPVHETAHVPTPEADVPVPRVPPPAERNAWQRFMYGTLDLGEDSPRAAARTPPRQTPARTTERNHSQPRDPGVWTGVKLGCGMFIVLPIIIAVVVVLVFVLVASGGG